MIARSLRALIKTYIRQKRIKKVNLCSCFYLKKKGKVTGSQKNSFKNFQYTVYQIWLHIKIKFSTRNFYKNNLYKIFSRLKKKRVNVFGNKTKGRPRLTYRDLNQTEDVLKKGQIKSNKN